MSAGTTPTAIPTVAGVPIYTPEVFSALLTRYSAAPVADTSGRWLLLEAAHVVGQTRLGPHLKTHTLMFGQARQEGDWLKRLANSCAWHWPHWGTWLAACPSETPGGRISVPFSRCQYAMTSQQSFRWPDSKCPHERTLN